MDPELKRLLEENHALAKDNHRMLRAMRRHQLVGTFAKLFFWLVVLGFAGYSYQEYLLPFMERLSAFTGAPAAGFNLPASAEIQKLIDSYKAGQ